MHRITPVLICLFSFLSAPACGQETGTVIKQDNRLRNTIIAAAAVDVAALTALGSIWYKDQWGSSFHFFNDYPEWLQADKAGHIYSAYHLSQVSALTLRNLDMPPKKAYLWGGVAGFLLLAQVEALDGFSQGYGASASDLVANAIGSALAWSQYSLWDEARIHPKFSFHRTVHAEKRPELLGANLMEEIIKNYNGQTYWLSFDMDKLLPQGNRFPKWLNIAAGYGVENITVARDKVNAYRQYYLSLDLDLTSVKTNSGLIKGLLYGLNMIHLPAPALEFNSRSGLHFHWLYF